MRKNYITFALLILFGLAGYSQNITLTSDTKLEGLLGITKSAFYDSEKLNFTINKNKSFTKQIKNSIPTEVVLFIKGGNSPVWCYVSPDKKVQISFFKNKQNQLDYTFAKEDNINQFLKQFHETFSKLIRKKKNSKELLAKNIDSVEAKYRKKLENLRNNISKDEYNILNSTIEGRMFSLKSYSGKYKRDTIKNIGLKLFNDGNFLPLFFSYSDNLSVSFGVFNYVLMDKNMKSHYKKLSEITEKIKFLKKFCKNQVFINAVVLLDLENKIKKGSEKNKKRFLGLVKDDISKKAYEFLKNIKANVTKGTQIGSAFKWFACLTTYAKPVATKNKVLYIDNWATWCMPCVESIKKSLKNKFKIPNNVVMVYVSFDRTVETASKFIKKLDFPEKNVLHLYNKGGANSDYANYYGIQSLPKYMVVANGKIKDLNPPHPQDPNFQKYLDSLSNL